MKILHYSLGLPPYRTGGLTKYSVDLMIEQKKQNNDVYLLYPGRIKLINKKDKIIKNKDYKGIKIYELINPLPVPLLNGILDVKTYTCSKDINVYNTLLDEIKPNIIHIHTLMGLPKEFVQSAKKKNIKVVYTSHDYFGLCPKVNFYCNEHICEKMNNKKCAECCKNALNFKKIFILQSSLYRKMKDSYLMKRIRQKFKNKPTMPENHVNNTNEITIDYSKLEEYYSEIFGLIDEFYFNSDVAYQEYKKHIKINKYSIIPITHEKIKDNRVSKNYSDKELNIGYIGPQTNAKGFNTLIKVMDDLEKQNYKFKLNIFFKCNSEKNYIIEHDRYNYDTINKVYEEIDILVVPSNWKETFGFGVLESISYGVPVICSKNVGASDIIKNNDAGYVYKTENDLFDVLKEICKSKEKLIEWNKNIKNINWSFDIEKHNERILTEYKKNE